MTPVMGVLLSALMLGEGAQAFHLRNMAALVLVCIGICLVNFAGRRCPENRMTGKGFLNKINCKYGWNEEKRKEGYH